MKANEGGHSIDFARASLIVVLSSGVGHILKFRGHFFNIYKHWDIRTSNTPLQVYMSLISIIVILISIIKLAVGFDRNLFNNIQSKEVKYHVLLSDLGDDY